MIDSVGKKLELARLEKGISIEEAARETKMRPERVQELEQDDFTHFPNLTYARGFLVLYAKFLNVDVSEFAAAFENANPVGVQDYEYLSNAPEPIFGYTRDIPKRSAKRLFKVLLFVGLLVVGVAVATSFILNFQRLGNLDLVGRKDATSTTAISPAPSPSTPPEPHSDAQVHVAPELVAVAPGQPAATPVEIRRAEPVLPPPAAMPEQPVVKDIVLMPAKKTWVKIQKDDQSSPPIFEDYLYPDARPLKLNGKRFWIEMRDEGALTIMQNGQPVLYEGRSLRID